MTGSDAPTLWLIIVALGVGTFLIRFSFLGLIGSRELPPWVLRHLRYTAVAVLPGLVAPLVLWPEATGGEPDLARSLAAMTTLVAAMWWRQLLIAVAAGLVVLYLGLWFGI